MNNPTPINPEPTTSPGANASFPFPPDENYNPSNCLQTLHSVVSVIIDWAQCVIRYCRPGLEIVAPVITVITLMSSGHPTCGHQVIRSSLCQPTCGHQVIRSSLCQPTCGHQVIRSSLCQLHWSSLSADFGAYLNSHPNCSTYTILFSFVQHMCSWPFQSSTYSWPF